MPKVDELSKSELNDIRKFITFCLYWDPGSSEPIASSGVRIIKIEFIYDGISINVTLGESDECIDGVPAPIIRYTLDKSVDPEEFKICVWESYVKLQPKSRILSDSNPCYLEDHNGYTEVLDDESIAAELEDEGLLISKVYLYPNGLEPFGIEYPALEFAMKISE